MLKAMLFNIDHCRITASKKPWQWVLISAFSILILTACGGGEEEVEDALATAASSSTTTDPSSHTQLNDAAISQQLAQLRSIAEPIW